MFGFFQNAYRAVNKLLVRDYQLDRRSAAQFVKVLGNVDRLDALERSLEVNANLEKPRIKKVDGLLE